MDSRTQERVERWDSRPFSGGHDGLADLAEADFSGAVTAAGTWLFLLNGRVVGVIDGSIEDFETGSGTVYEAPHPSLPLLCTMESRGGETRTRYYTNETSLRDVDRTLQEGSFTGYIELSENVLSGDYYAVYYGGRRMAAAYIGNARRLVTGDDAFERAADEVGIYEVVDVEIDVTDVPGATESNTDSAGTDDESVAGAEAAAGTLDEPRTRPESGDSAPDPRNSAADPEGTDERVATTETDPDRNAANESVDAGTDTSADSIGASTQARETADTASGERVDSAEPESGPSTDRTTASAPEKLGATAADEEPTGDSDSERAGSSLEAAPSPDADAKADADPEPDSDANAADTSSARESASSRGPEDADAAAGERDRTADDVVDEAAGHDERSADEASSADSEPEERFEREEQRRETRRMSSLEPDRGEATADESSSARAVQPMADVETETETEAEQTTHRSPSQPERSQATDHSGNASNAASQHASADQDHDYDHEDRSELRQRLETLAEQRDALRAAIEELETERQQLRSKNRELVSTVERLESRIGELEAELERVRENDAGRERAATQLSRQQALSQTNLFVRYASRSQPTLETAHQGRADRDEVASNLRLEHHTQFDETAVTVDGESYEAALAASMEYRFVDWLTGATLYEIRDTGHADELAALYDAIPRIDRLELHGSISLESDGAEDVPDHVQFDIVAYDKMGTPLLVANLNDSREPASREMLEELEAAASAVAAEYPDLAAAVVVTASYFEPGALEVVERATASGFLSRGSDLSYVNVSRKRGYHLCLVESRSGEFHVNVPEL